MHRLLRGLTSLAAIAACGCGDGSKVSIDYSGPTAEWREYGGDKGGLKYSALSQINRGNVNALRVAWEHHSGDFSDGKSETSKTTFQVTPLVVGDTLYYCTPFNRIFALDAETGKQRWVFDPGQGTKKLFSFYQLNCRGVAYWADGQANDRGSAVRACRERIFEGTTDSELIAVDAKTGKLCPDFGNNGRISLRDGLAKAPAWEYFVTSPPMAVRDVVVVGALVADDLRTDAPAGVVRAFDARTGALRWAWDPVPPDWKKSPEDQAARRYQPGTPNVWSVFSADEERGLVFAPTGNAPPDSFGGLRRGLDHYASSIVALDAATGEVRWRFQTVHHDLWDYDVASQPALFQIPGVGDGVPAVAQATKTGNIFLLNRVTGEPLYPVEERAVAKGDVPGENYSPTQPIATHPPPLHPADFTAKDAWGLTFIDRADCREKLSKLRIDGIFTPPSLQGSLEFPGPLGGANWGGVSIDPVNAILYVNMSRLAWVVQLIPRDEYDKMDKSKIVMPANLGPMKGTPFAVKRGPLLSNFGMPCVPPPWGTLTAVDLRSGKVLWEETLGTTRDRAPWPLWFKYGTPTLGGSIVTAGGLVFIAATSERTIRAFDARNGEELWQHRLPFTGNATPMTYRVRKDGKQFLVIAAGGHALSESGDALVAFALPDK
ncbi:MAG: pyrroloquinoline quinone-dependent dehydrogenase [Betaproteobacteria bacterium]|nr:pyrroloquinoline quinone-dependent dehydrogenase [Betaproteobacteria bacterium]